MNRFSIKILALIALSINSQNYCKELNFHTDNKENCKICHVSSNEINYETPIWTNEKTENYYIPYSSSTLDANIGQPSGVTKMCLSCHDGTIAVDDQGGNANFTHKVLSSEMNSNHPVSFVYNSFLAQKDGELYDPQTTSSGLGSTIEADLLIDGKLECISCHNPHKEMNNSSMLKISNLKSKLCLTCHIK
ncbi:MAG: cytochrome c3 family protein [Ignavibacteriae bacterium]|nr:cytochrome c3 family protein [Ignavibacteriota bacterium]MCB9208254.1 cytochrome c3 family protein [Ignavibacteriales bacterium]MCB9259016.1 cytochrome c3 family protein [Ignavibacteriales bacterium]